MTGHTNVALHFYAPGVSQRTHAHDVTTVTLILSGSLREMVGNADVIAGPFSVGIKPAGVKHANLFGTAITRTVQLTLDRPDLGGESSAPLERWRWTDASSTVMRAFVRLAAAHQQRSNEIENLTTDAVAALLSFDDRRRHNSPRWLQRVREALDDCDRGLRIGELAAIAGVHPVHLARQFRRYYGCSITGYVHMKRARAAAHSIARGTALTAAAYDSGFSDHAHMSRIFKRTTGVTPSAFFTITNAKVRILQDADLVRP